MITVTQNKVASFEPRWAAFPGFSILFDNPGDSTRPADGLVRIACSADTEVRLDLYRKLDESLRELDRERLVRNYLLCPLPPPSYHVTVWDGINADNIPSVQAAIKSDWSAFLDGLPGSLAAPPASIAVVTESALLKASKGALSFRFDELNVWRNQALVARLQPTEPAFESYQRLCLTRANLCKRAEQELGVSPARNYSPHVTLGYFANQEGGRLANVELERWTELFRQNTRDTEISYRSLAVYGFTDMISFYALRGTR